MVSSPDTQARLLDALRQFGEDAVSFQGLESHARQWIDDADESGTGAVIPYVASGGSWIAIGAPLVEAGRRSLAARRFADAARAQKRRAVFLAIEELASFPAFRRAVIGLQSELRPSQWAQTLRAHPRLREQLRRARAKGVTVRRVAADELREGRPLRVEVDRLREEWLGSRAMEPLRFLVEVELFHAPEEHLYVIAERHGRPVHFLSAVPIYGRSGWLMEDLLRGRDAPNGSTELLIDGVMRELGGDPHWVTPGLTPLAGPVPTWLAWTRTIASPLYDFAGLRRFRSRLQPSAWHPVWIAWDRGPLLLALLDVIRAFAGGRLVRFASRTLLKHPNGPPWALAIPLLPWTLALVVLASTGRSRLLGFSTAVLSAWIVFDVVLAALLLKAASRPRSPLLSGLAAAAAFDAILSWRHLLAVGTGGNVWSGALRLLAAAAPAIAAPALAWAAYRARHIFKGAS
jgi:hypothetical protein